MAFTLGVQHPVNRKTVSIEVNIRGNEARDDAEVRIEQELRRQLNQPGSQDYDFFLLIDPATLDDPEPRFILHGCPSGLKTPAQAFTEEQFAVMGGRRLRSQQPTEM